MDYKLIASDLDGTLLLPDMSVSEQNLAAIAALAQKGVHFVPASGRTLREIPAELTKNPHIRYVIYSNGAATADLRTGEQFLRCIPKDLSNFVLQTTAPYATHITLRQGGVSYCNASQQTAEYAAYCNLWDVHQNILQRLGVAVEDFDTFAQAADNVEMYAFFFHSKAEKAECHKRLKANPQLLVAEATAYNLEVFSAKAGKGNALLDLADRLGLTPAQTIAMGDSDNDTTMLRAAGLGLAMQNACDDLKKVANQVICHHLDHGVQWVLEHYFA